MRKNISPAKITRPKLPDIFPRKRLFTVLDSGRKKTLTWIAGPAGSGKTTLVASYLDARRLPCLWYHVNAGDADIATFFYYMGLAAQKAAPRYRKPLPVLSPEYLQGISTFTRRFFENLYHRLKPPFAVVFDDYQDALADSRIHDIVTHAVSNAPEGIRVFVLSRNGTPPAFARLRANSAVQTVGWNELRFTLEESKRIIRLYKHRTLTEDALAELHRRTEGWAAGLVLMMEGAGTETQGLPPPGKGAQKEVFDYFAGEVFDKLDSETGDFLLMTAFLPSMTAQMAVKMTDQENAGRILSALNHNYFLTEKNQTGEPTYQYHALFREFLLSRMKESLNSEGILRVQNRAASILEEAGQIEDAASIYREAQNWEKYIPLILGHAQLLIAQGRSKTLEGWLNSLPREYIDGSPWALYWQGICRMPFDPRESRGILEKAFERFKAHADATGSFLSWSIIIDTFVYEWGDFSPLDRWIVVLEELLSEYRSFPSPEIEARVAAGMLNAMTYRQPFHADLPLWAERVKLIILKHQSVQLRMMLGNHLIIYYLWIGDFAKAGLVIDALRPVSGLKKNDPLTQQTWYVMEAMYSWFMADSKTCMQAVSNGLKSAENSGVHLLNSYLLGQGVWSGLSWGDPSAASSCLEKMSELNSPRPMDKAFYQYQASSFEWYHGNYKKAIEHGELAVKLTGDVGCPFAQALCLTELAVTLFDDGQCEGAEIRLAAGGEVGRGINQVAYACFLHGARFAFDQGKEEQGLDLLKQGLALGAQQGYVNMPRWNDSNMARLCAKALEAGIEVEYVKGLIRKRNLQPDASFFAGESWPWPIKIHTLGRFELVKDGEPVKFSGKVQKKPLELLKAIIALGGLGVREDMVLDALWPEAEGDAARISFRSTLHRLRQLLGKYEFIVLQDGRISLDRGYCWVDAWAFEKILNDGEQGLRKAGLATKIPAVNPILLEKTVKMYQGHFLSEEEDKPWAASFRERLRNKYLSAANALGDYWQEQGKASQKERAKLAMGKAIKCYQRGLEIDDVTEEFYQNLMLCNHKIGRKAEAVKAYQRCKNALAAAFGIGPSEETESIYKMIAGQ